MIFLIDESGKFTFDAKNPQKTFVLAAGVAVSMHNAELIVDYIKANYSRDGNLLKGSSISNDNLVKKFIEQLLNYKACAAVSAGDHIYVQGADATIFKERFCDDLIKFAYEPHPEYQGLKDDEAKKNLQSKVSLLIASLKKQSLQEFFQLLMIFDVIDGLIRKILTGFCPLEASFDGITIVIDTQVEDVISIIDEDLFHYFLFVVSRKKAFDLAAYFSIFKKYINGPYIDTSKLIKEINIRSDSADKRLYIADYVASFYSKSLNGVITREDVIDKLLFLHRNKLQTPYIFHPTLEEIDFPPAEKNQYAVDTLFR